MTLTAGQPIALLDQKLGAILGDNEKYVSMDFSVPTDEDRLADPEHVKLASWPIQTEDERNISEFNAAAKIDIIRLAEFAQERATGPEKEYTPLLHNTFKTTIEPLTGLTYQEFIETTPPVAVQAIEIFLNGIWLTNNSEQTFYHVRNVAAISTDYAGKIYDAIKAIPPETLSREKIGEVLGTTVSDRDAHFLSEVSTKYSRSQFMSLYCASALLHDFGKLFTPNSLLDYDKILPTKTFNLIIDRINKCNGKLFREGSSEPITGPDNFTDSLMQLVQLAQNFSQDSDMYDLDKLLNSLPIIGGKRTDPIKRKLKAFLEQLANLYLDPEHKQPLLFPDEALALSADPAHSKGTMAEREVIKLHVMHSSALIDELGISDPIIKRIIDSAKYHHEWMDGSPNGYGPDEIRPKGDAIPLLGRTMKIVDTFESMVNGMRKYKSPRTLEQANNILTNKESNGSIPTTPINEFDTGLVKFAGPEFFSKFYTAIEEQVKAFLQYTSTIGAGKELGPHHYAGRGRDVSFLASATQAAAGKSAA